MGEKVDKLGKTSSDDRRNTLLEIAGIWGFS
jgi:hypothetical protein